MADVFTRPLKSISAEQLAEAFSITLTELLGEAYNVSVQSVDYEPTMDAPQHDTAQMQIKIMRLKAHMAKK